MTKLEAEAISGKSKVDEQFLLDQLKLDQCVVAEKLKILKASGIMNVSKLSWLPLIRKAGSSSDKGPKYRRSNDFE